MNNFFKLIATIFFLYAHAHAIDIGFSTHLGQGKPSYSLVKEKLEKISISNIRGEIYWSDVEKEKNILSFEKVPSGIKLFLETYDEHKIETMLALGYGNDHYDFAQRPVTKDAIDGYVRYAQTIATSTKYSPQLIEIWNEWNLSTGYKIKDKGTPEDYVRLAQSTIKGLRSVNYSGKIIIGGIGGDWPDWAFTRRVAASGVLSLADGYSVHLYNFVSQSTPDEMIIRLKRLQAILQKHNDGKPYPIYVTETGWPTNKGRFGSTELEKNYKLSKLIAEASTLSWLKGIWFYGLFDSGKNPKEIEHNFGFYSGTGNKKVGNCLVIATARLAQNGKILSTNRTSNGYNRYVYSINGKTVAVELQEKFKTSPNNNIDPCNDVNLWRAAIIEKSKEKSKGPQQLAPEAFLKLASKIIGPL